MHVIACTEPFLNKDMCTVGSGSAELCRITFVWVSSNRGRLLTVLAASREKSMPLGGFSSLEHGERVCLSGLSAWLMRAVIRCVHVCVCLYIMCVACICWQLPGKHWIQVFRKEEFGDMRSWRITFSCNRDFHCRTSHVTKKISLSSAWQVNLSKRINRRCWIRLENYAGVSIPWAGAGALSVHDPSSTGSGAVGPRGPCRPLTIDRPGTMLPILNTLTPPTPLKERERRKQYKKQK